MNESILRRAIAEKKIQVSFYNPRDFTDDKWARVDRRPYGGGPGMVLEAESILRAVAKAIGRKDRKQVKIVFLRPDGKQFSNSYADTVLKRRYKHIIIICGRYEGIDARVQKILRAEALTVGPYTLTGGELPAMIMIDTIARRLPGVLGNDESVEERRVSGRDVYTRPEVLQWKGKNYRVPKVLLSGDHKKIEAWKRGESS